jgi:hypothetical protein
MALLSPLSNELALLVACDLATDEELACRIAVANRSGFDWDRFEYLARGNEMAGLVAARLAQVARAEVPARMLKSLDRVLQSSIILELSQTAAAARLTQRLADAGVRSIVLKGMALSHMLYPAHPYWRSSTDIDMLIAPEDLATADRVIQESGFARSWPEREVPDIGQDMFRLLANVFDYTSPQSGQLVELHHRITLNPSWVTADFDELHSASVEVRTTHGSIRGLDGPHLVSYLCWHAFAHFGFRLKWFCDIVRALRQSEAASCSGLVTGAEKFAQAPLELADTLLAAILPAAGGKRPVATSGRWARHANRILADMENPTDMPSSRSFALLTREFGFRLFLMRLSPGWRGKGYELLRAVADPRDVSILRLGKRFAPIYALTGPFLALRRLALSRADTHGPHLH